MLFFSFSRAVFENNLSRITGIIKPATVRDGGQEDLPASTAGYCVGNIVITTDGRSIFTVSADGDVHQSPVELTASGLPRSFTIDEIRPIRRRPARRGSLMSAAPLSVTVPMVPAERRRPFRAQTLVDCPSIQNAIDA